MRPVQGGADRSADARLPGHWRAWRWRRSPASTTTIRPRAICSTRLDAAFKVLDTRRERFRARRSFPSCQSARLWRRVLRQRPRCARHLARGHRQPARRLTWRSIGTGHAHIDVAWLWTLDQTRRKAGRTFHNVLRLMEQFPDYHFTQSQPQLYDYVRQDYPALFEAIKAAGRRKGAGNRSAACGWRPTAT